MKKVILLVEDNDRLRNTLKDCIENDGVYKVVAVENGFVAYEWLKNNQEPALVLTDFHMPCRGDILAKSVTRLNIPILMMSETPDQAAKALIESRIRCPVTSKSVSLTQILNIIDKLTNTSINNKQTS